MATVGENFYLSGGNWDGYYSKSVAKVQRNCKLTPTLSEFEISSLSTFWTFRKHLS